MSLTIVQMPISPSYSSMVRDIIVSSTGDITFELKLGSVSILSEIYTPDAQGMVFIRNIGKVCRNYLQGKVLQANGLQNDIVKTFTAIINGGIPFNFEVQRCDAYIKTTRDIFTSGSLQRFTHKGGIEFLTMYMTSEYVFNVELLKIENNELVSRDSTMFLTPQTSGFQTITTSFWSIQSKYSSWDYTNTVGYRITCGNWLSVDYMLDYTDYISINYFLYKNVFGVSETLTVVPEIKHKQAVTNEFGWIHDENRKFNVRRNDTIEVNVGALRNQDEYIRLREMFGSDEVYVFDISNNEWLPIVITDIKDENPETLSLVSPIAFSYQFAKEKHNVRL